MRLSTRFGDEFHGILRRGFELVDELSFAFLPVLTLFVLFAAYLEGALFADLSFVLFLFFEGLGGLFFALDVEFY